MKRQLITALVLAGCLALVVVVPAMAQSGNTWYAQYYNNTSWSGYPAYAEYLGFLSMDWGYGAPPYVQPDNFTARFTSDAPFNAGNYNFTLIADDEIALYIDGSQRWSTIDKAQSGKPQYFTIQMASGWHHLEVLYREYTVTANLYVTWVPAGGGTTPVPPGPVSEPLPKNQTAPLITQYGDFTPCMQQNIHQVNCFNAEGSWDLNSGSVGGEPQIQSWIYCEPKDAQKTYYVSPEFPNKPYKCSKTMAGWYPQ